MGDGQGPGGYDSCYVDRKQKGVPDKNGEWNSYFVNPGSASWRAHFLRTAKEMEAKYGVDGFFLDTIETATVYPDFKPGMISLIKQLRAEHPKAIIILNRGFDVIDETIADVDGFMFEDFSAGHYFDARGYTFNSISSLDATREQAEKYLLPHMQKDGLVVLALDYAANAQEPYLTKTADRAVTFGFIPYASTYSLGTIFDTTYQGKADPKYLSELSTPEALAISLKDASNGFPSGTRIMPSSTYPDYSLAPITDGIEDRSKLTWMNAAWASQEKKTPHFLEFQFPQPVHKHQLIVDWAIDNGQAFPSRSFKVEVKLADDKDGDWKKVWATQDNLQRHCEISLTDEPISALRVTQSLGGGSTARPDLMWVEQVKVQ